MASIIKVLEEIVHTEEKLVEKSPPKTAIQNGSPVLLAAGYGLKIVLVNGARIGNGITCSDKSADKQALFGVEIVIDAGDAVIAPVIVIGGAEEIVRGCWSVLDGAGPESAQQRDHDRVW